ncbi:MAG: Arm DNA-binding domain-containing protein [Acinetobacter venetianus]|uniref:Arm DNA-binding domain-containing protein n=1 Tax=Acinetobacter venetianus TaxID=52133 RepID=UPI003C725556
MKDTHLDNLEPEAKEYRISCDTGLYFRVLPTGKKSWQLRFKDDSGKWKWHSMALLHKAILEGFFSNIISR